MTLINEWTEVENDDNGSLKTGQIKLEVGVWLHIEGEEKQRRVTNVMGSAAKGWRANFSGQGAVPLGRVKWRTFELNAGKHAENADSVSCQADLSDIPYSARQLIVIVDDEAPHSSTNVGIDVVRVAVEAFAHAFWPIPAAAVAELFAQLTRLRDEGAAVAVVPRSKAARLRFSPGHPRANVLYVGHPADPQVYYTAAQFHRMTFEHKFAEAIRLLMALGATTIDVQHMIGWSSEFTARMSPELPSPALGAMVSASKSGSEKSSALFVASLKGTENPEIPDDLIWYHHEPAWQAIAIGRLKYGLKNFELRVSYEDDFGVNAGLKAKVARAGLDLGGRFEDHQATVWKLVGEFE